MAFDEVRSRIFALYGSRDYEEALDVVRKARGDFPVKDAELTFYEACMLGRLGRSAEALTVLTDGLDRGLWWPPAMLADADLDPVRALSGWEALADRCAEVTEERMGLRPPPVVRQAEDPTGTILTLQGAYAEQQTVASTWQAAAPITWTVITPAGAEPTASGGWAWHDSIEASAESVTRDTGRLRLDRPLVLTGFSLGSAIACHLITTKALPVDGLIAVAPSSPSGFDELRAVTDTGTTALIICGDQDPRQAKYRRLQADVGGRANVTLDMVEGLGHAYPPDLDRRIFGFLDSLATHRF